VRPLPANAVLLVIDVQTGFEDPVFGARNNPEAEHHIARLLHAWRTRGAPVVIFQHLSRHPESPFYPGRPGTALKPVVSPTPGDVLMTKRVNSCFIGTDLEAWLRTHGLDTIVVTGLTTAHCCSTTIRMGANLGFTMWAVDDAMATFEAKGRDGRVIPPDVVHDVELAALRDEFATVVRTADVLALS
jgi:nicotinamidase-related amidase